jgi:predicted ATPase
VQSVVKKHRALRDSARDRIDGAIPTVSPCGVIASVAFRNYKALRGARLALQPFNLLIGPNGSGKTSLIQALMRLQSLAAAPTPARSKRAPASRAGSPELVFGFTKPYAALRVRLRCISEVSCDLLEVTPAKARNWPALRRALGKICAYHFDHRSMFQPGARGDGAELTANGGNLAAVLHRLQAEAPSAFAQLQGELVRIIPEFGRIEFSAPSLAQIEFALRLADGSELVRAEDLSQGTLYVLGMLAVVFDPDPPPVVCLEEIDRGIHPRLLREVRDLLYRLSYPAAFGDKRAPVQVIATTHSPYLLDLFREHPEEIVITYKHGNSAGFERLADRTDLKELLSEGSLGDMWFSGILGGVPDEP